MKGKQIRNIPVKSDTNNDLLTTGQTIFRDSSSN